jgi:uncharacterized tellurite resistance protein B-like protein
MAVSKFSDVMDKSKLSAEERNQQKTFDARVAAAILLVAVVKADGRIERMEFAEVIDILSKQFNLPASEVGHLLEQASDSIGIDRDLNTFTMRLRNAWSEEDRLKLLKNLWGIAIADALIDDRERELIERLAKMLDLKENEIDAAREQAERQLEFKSQAPNK